jgi:hypothetical protein
MILLLFLSGIFTVLLGGVHIFMPVLLDFEHAIPAKGAALKPFRLLFYEYQTTRSDVRGIAWVMNHSVSFTLLSIGLLDLIAYRWRGTELASLLAGWIALWWFLRAACQFYLGRRPGDWMVCAWFCLLGALHAVAVFYGN